MKKLFDLGWKGWAQVALWSLWIPALFMIPFHGDIEATALLTVIFAGGAALSWNDGVAISRAMLFRWASSIQRALLLSAIWLLTVRVWIDPWEDFPTMLFATAILLSIRYCIGLVLILSRVRMRQEPVSRDNWQFFAHWSLYPMVILNVLEVYPWAHIADGISLLLVFASSCSFLAAYYRDPHSRSALSVATQITLSRIVLAPVFIAVFFYDGDSAFSNNSLIFQSLALLMGIASAVTDWLDGHLARKMGQVTVLGKYLDPFSDKIATMTIFLCFLGTGFANVWMIALIYYRESAVETLRTLAAAQGIVIDARRSGKWKTGIQIGGIITILTLGLFDGVLGYYGLAIPYWTSVWHVAPRTIMWIVTAITVASGFDYFAANRRVLGHYA